MFIVAIEIRTKDWEALMQVLRQAHQTCPPRIADRFVLYRNAHNASRAWLLLECPESTAPIELQEWVEQLQADLAQLDGHDTMLIDSLVWESIESFG